ncbi:MAG TPA: hypothetical protein VFQ13_16380 [Anaerolineales bacterium]|nr:hypothetical protein [Anaerolineales bacterium]
MTCSARIPRTILDIALQLPAELLQRIQSGADRLTISTQFLIQLQKNPMPTIVVLEDLHWADEPTQVQALAIFERLGARPRRPAQEAPSTRCHGSASHSAAAGAGTEAFGELSTGYSKNVQ